MGLQLREASGLSSGLKSRFQHLSWYRLDLRFVGELLPENDVR